MNAPTAAVLVIGNEILSGRTRDVNTTTAARLLTAHGIALREARVVPDGQAAIVEAVNALRARYTYLFTSGGIGPTHDDITAAAVAKALGAPLTEHPEAVALMAAHYGDPAKLTPARRKMALVPRGARLIGNALTGAPGFALGNVFVMAGVPAIMEAMLAAALSEIPPGPEVFTATVDTTQPESAIAAALEAVQIGHAGVNIGSYPHFDAHRRRSMGVQVVIRGRDASAVEAARAAVEQAITQSTV
ncbi:MAG TPA: competence/damage-inducible protein A [Rhodospirillaceae bacterium]|jgi:molybdenum cofactor synthesis domain-containing protein|nr:competence/damage-inducible protein A [Alphaproteobacteria bacterium]HBH26603.1 competence/damage-inducible protein A [Rhodospirillaceae bacterium]